MSAYKKQWEKALPALCLTLLIFKPLICICLPLAPVNSGLEPSVLIEKLVFILVVKGVQRLVKQVITQLTLTLL